MHTFERMREVYFINSDKVCIYAMRRIKESNKYSQSVQSKHRENISKTPAKNQDKSDEVLICPCKCS